MARETERPQIVWEQLNSDGGGVLHWDVHRAKVPGGWLVLVIHNATGLTFTQTRSTDGMAAAWREPYR